MDPWNNQPHLEWLRSRYFPCSRWLSWSESLIPLVSWQQQEVAKSDEVCKDLRCLDIFGFPYLDYRFITHGYFRMFDLDWFGWFRCFSTEATLLISQAFTKHHLGGSWKSVNSLSGVCPSLYCAATTTDFATLPLRWFDAHRAAWLQIQGGSLNPCGHLMTSIGNWIYIYIIYQNTVYIHKYIHTYVHTYIHTYM